MVRRISGYGLAVISLSSLLIVFSSTVQGFDPQRLATATAQATTPPSQDDESNTRDFPNDLYCSSITRPYAGPGWNGLVIGQSTLKDLVDRLSDLDGELSVYFADNLWGATFPEATSINTPVSVFACISGNIVTVLQITRQATRSPMDLSDLIAKYGPPDAITWTPGPATRLALWFGKGIGAELVALPNEPTWGSVFKLIYFPYQSTVDYQQRWPYKYTRLTIVGDLYHSHKQNPFDIAAIVATITAQPSRTPTSTFTPRPTRTATATTTPANLRREVQLTTTPGG